MASSEAMKTLLTDDVPYRARRPMTAMNNRTSYNNSMQNRRPVTGHHCSRDVNPPWINPNAVPTGPKKKFRTSIKTRPIQSRTSQGAPYASRVKSSNSNYDQPKVVNGKVFTKPDYNSLDDPYLNDYFARKLGQLPKLTDKKKKSKSRKRDKSVYIAYSVTVITGDKRNAGTNANVFINLRGTLGRINKQHLMKELDADAMEIDDDETFQFKRATSERFTVSGVDIGDLISVEIEHDGVERNQSWFLEEVSVKKYETKQTWVLPCKKWLSLYEDDCHVKRILKPLPPEQARPERVVYEVEVLTGDVRGAGTDAHVFITIYGERGNTGRVQLVNRNVDTFERSRTDLFKIKVKYLGKLQRILIEHDNTGFAAGWFLDRVTITNSDSPKEKWYFVCNKWLSKDDGDGEISRLVQATKSLDSLATTHKYTISTHTGDVRGAGTDANVFITLFSKDGNSAEMKLNDSKNNFERKKVDTFKVDCPNIGGLTRVRIRHDNKGVAAGWFLDKIVVKDMANNTFEFPCARWLSESEDDGQISRDLVLAGDHENFVPGLLYNLHITTADVRGAGTSAKVYVILYSEDGSLNSGKLWIRNGKSDNFERGRTDLFQVECAEQLSPVHHLTIGHDNAGVGAGWNLEKVILEAPSTGIIQTFFCRQWLADDEGDKLIERDLFEDIDYRKQREKKNFWNVMVTTSDLRGAGTDSNVCFVLYGDKGKGEEIQLENKTDNFERGSVDRFKVDIKDVGIPYKIRIGHDNSKAYSDWHLDKVLLENSSTNERYQFECNRWIGSGEDDGQCVRELPAIGGKGDPLPVIPYEVQVYTGDKRGAGTDANVFLNVFGERGDTGERPLLKSKTNFNKFERKNVDEFILEAVSLSELTSIRVGHDGKNSGAGWFLDKIIVRDPTDGKQFPFLCGRWLASDEDDGQIVREIPVGDTATLLKTTSYHVRVKTGDVRGAGTDANVFIRIFGEIGDTGKLQLRQADNTKDKWERGRTDMFTLEAMDIGKVSKIIIGHDGKGLGAGWFVDSIILDVPSQGQQMKFACNRWLAEDEDDGLIERELYPSEENELTTKVPYEIEVHTGDVRGAGTNSNVFVVMYGKEKKSEEMWLRNKTDNFERGEIDKFKVECEEIGPLTKLRVGHDNKGMGAAWFLDKIIVHRLKPPAKKMSQQNGETKEEKRKKKKKKKRSSSIDEEEVSDKENEEEDDCNVLFPCNRWLAKGEDDGQIIRELIPYDSTGTRARRNTLTALQYDVHVHTGDVRGSGTNSNVFMTIYGDKGDSGERELKKSETHFDKFERNQEDVFKVEAMDLGKVTKVKIRHDNSGLKSSWYLDKIVVMETKSGSEYIFPCNRWLSKTEDDGALSRELVAVDKQEFERRRQRSLQRKQTLKRSASVAGDNIDLEQKAEKTTYNIHVATGDVKGAGTDANVYVYLFGEKGDSGMVALKTSKTNSDKFERNQTDTFTVEAIDLGTLKRIKIGHDNKGGFAGWYLDNVVIDAPSVGKKWTFPAGRWLDKGKDDGLLEVELFPLNDKEEVYEKHVPYEIVIYTSDISGAGSDSNIFITLYGSGGLTTDELILTDTKKKRKECFNRASMDVFVRELPNIGEQIEKIRIGHDNKGFGAAWHLDKVEVRRLSETEEGAPSSVTHTFLCNRWFAKNEDDGAIVRELVPSKISQEAVDKDGKLAVTEHRVDALQMHNYKIRVFTGELKGSGTDANVFITLYGENGDTGERPLTKSETYRDKFEKGHEDIFTIEAADLGYVRKIMIRHDNSNLGSDWYLDRVEIEDVSEGRNFIFSCERWLAKKKEDGKIKRTLYEKGYTGDQNSMRSSMSTMSLADSRHLGASSNSLTSVMTTKSGRSSPSLSRKASVRSTTADKVFENEVKGKLKKAASRTSLTSVMETIPYTVRISTGDKSEHETQASAFIVFIGTEAASDQIDLDLIGKEKFEAGSVETFSVESPDVGDIKKIEFGHDGYQAKDSWYVKHIEIDVPTTGRRYFIPLDCWLGKDKEDGKTSRIFSVDEHKEIEYKPKTPYQVTIYTGDEKGAGTDSELKMTLFGEQGKSEEIALEKDEERFERNSVDLLRLDLEDVGTPTKLKFESNGKGSRPHWLLEKVVLMNLNTEHVTIFQCNDWISKTKGNTKKLIRELGAEVDGKKIVKETTYTINVVTGDKRGCGTDANVFLIIFGQKGNSDELALKDSLTNKDKFERGKTDTFNFSMLSLGQLTKIRIWHDNKYMRAGWFLQGVDIVDDDTQEKYNFPCERWLAKDEDDGSLMRELPCSNSLMAAASKESLAVAGYEVTMVTSDKGNAGSTNNVNLILIDEQGKKSKDILIENKSKLLKRGQTDVVQIASKPLAALKTIMVTLTERKGSTVKNSDSSSKWHLQELRLKDLEEDVTYVFEHNDWVNLSTVKESKHVRLNCARVEKSRVNTIRELKPVQYELRVYTADVKGSGTDANVYVTLYGENGDTGKRELKKKFRDLFERAQMDDFKIEALDLGPLTKLVIGHDNKGFGAGWMLDHVDITNMADNTMTTFPCNEWLDKKKGDKKIERELFPTKM